MAFLRAGGFKALENTVLRAMKVIGVSGSARRDGNTVLLLRTVFEELTAAGIETEVLQLCDQEIAPCRGCFACKKGRCIIDDDFTACLQQVTEADGLILASPVYSADVSAKMKAFLERAGVVIAMNPNPLRHKVGAAIAAVRRGGGLTAVDTMNHFLLNKEVFLVGSTYWNMVYGKEIGEVLADEEGMANMRNLGRNMAYLLQQLHKDE